MNFCYETPRLFLKVLSNDSTNQVLHFLSESKEYFDQFEAQKPKNFYTYIFQNENLKAEHKGFLHGKYVRFYVFPKEQPDKIIGTVSFCNIIPSPYHCATVGYKFSPQYQHVGYASEAVLYSIYCVFRDLHIHRVDAYVMPNNIPSINLLERIGFTYEGLCHQYIKINGIYEDFFRYAVINNLC